MVLRESPPNPMLSMRNRSVPTEDQYDNQNFTPYDLGIRSNHAFAEPIGVMPSIHHHLGERAMPRSIAIGAASAEESQISHTRHLMDLLEAAHVTDNNQAHVHGLSLSLNSPMLDPDALQFRHRTLTSADFSGSPSGYVISGESREACNASNNYASASRDRLCYASAHGSDAFPVNFGNSRYLRPAQSLLEEVVSTCESTEEIANEKYFRKLYGNGDGRRAAVLGLVSELRAEFCNDGHPSAEKHELQAKIAKLVYLLEEVEARFEKYYHHMEEVISSFESVAGVGAAKSYTALALHAMSRHFSNIRDAIVSQIKITRRKLYDDPSRISSGLSRLGLFDRESRHRQRMSLQQLGLIHSHRQAWRPIRGLPETSVVILRAWLFEHFLHPYPNDSEKLILASQTGLSKNQVSNWFINARVRLWKPMIEEMYKEEFADSSEDSNPLLRCSMTDEDTINHEDE